MRRYYGANGAVRHALTTAVADVAPNDELIGSLLDRTQGTHELAHAAARAVGGDHVEG